MRVISNSPDIPMVGGKGLFTLVGEIYVRAGVQAIYT
jgi:hypothetical protein